MRIGTAIPKIISIALTLGFLSSPLTVYAADPEKDSLDEVFKSACIKSWMERASKSSDQVGFKNVGEKFCECAANKPIKTEAEIDHAAQVCLSQVLLRDTMDNIESTSGLSNLSESSIKSACDNEWVMIYPEITAADKVETSNYCSCASTKLRQINETRDSLTDKDWYKKIDDVAIDCSGKVKPDKVTVEKAQK